MPKQKRRRRSVEEVRALLARARARGLSPHELAEEAGVQPGSVNRWIRRERETGAAETALVPVRVVGPDVASRAGRDDRIGVTLEGAFVSRDVQLDLPRGVEPGDLRTLLHALAEHAC